MVLLGEKMRDKKMARHLIRFDWAMKKLLRSKANFGILEGFLSELLKDNLKIIELLDSESNKEDEREKFNRVDILVKLESGELVLVEVQTDTQYDFFQRMLFGTSKIVTEHMIAGQAYSNIKKVYSVNILYFDLGHGSDYIYHGTTSFIGIHNHDQLDLSEKQKELFQKDHIHQIYPEYYIIKLNQFNDVAKNTLDQWIYFLKNEEIKDDFNAKGLIEAKEKLDSFKLPEQERKDYNRFMENSSYRSSMYTSGKIDGKKEGINEGRIEEKTEIAKKLKAMGITNEVIHQSTGLSIDKINLL